MIRNRFFWLRVGRSYQAPDCWEMSLIIRPQPSLTGEGYLVAGRHFEIRFRMPSLTFWSSKVGPTA